MSSSGRRTVKRATNTAVSHMREQIHKTVAGDKQKKESAKSDKTEKSQSDAK